MKDPRIVALRNRAERDFSISDGALRLILRICSEVYTNPHRHPDDDFPLSAAKVAQLCGFPRAPRPALTRTAKRSGSKRRPVGYDAEMMYRRIYELLPQPGVTYGAHRKSYLKRTDDAASGCPPQRWFKLNL